MNTKIVLWMSDRRKHLLMSAPGTEAANECLIANNLGKEVIAKAVVAVIPFNLSEQTTTHKDWLLGFVHLHIRGEWRVLFQSIDPLTLTFTCISVAIYNDFCYSWSTLE
jgi:hypothetical protein